MKINEIIELLGDCKNKTIFESFVKADAVINRSGYNTILCSISGGADSDVVLDICHKIDKDKKIKYVWFDTGIEYQATKDHLIYLENKYDIEIIREKAIKSVPLSVQKFGQPFMSKYISDMMHRLQKHNFQFEDKSFEELYKMYPKNKSSLRWWTNNWQLTKNGYSRFNINYSPLLKEFIIANPPQFTIHNKCCDYAKKNVAKHLVKKYNADLNIYGVRQAEGGARSTAYKNCFTDNSGKNKESHFRPIFYYKDTDREEYEKLFNIKHSKCYTEYGLKRTGCAGCPYGKEFEEELQIIEKYEPKLYIAVNNIFKDSYEYTRSFLKFRKDKKEQC